MSIKVYLSWEGRGEGQNTDAQPAVLPSSPFFPRSLPLQCPCASPAAISHCCYSSQDGYLNSLGSIFVQRESSCITGLQINLLSHIHTGTWGLQEQQVPQGKVGHISQHRERRKSNNRSNPSSHTFLHFSLRFGVGEIAFLN